MSAPSKLATQLSKVALSWPADPFRPHLQLKTFLEHMSTHRNLTPQAVQATRALQEDVLFKKYPLSERTLKPASKPLHYQRLQEGLNKASQGIKRPWWKVLFGIW